LYALPVRISPDEVKTTALMARLELTAEELTRLQAELDAILSYMETLSELDVSAIEPTTHAVPLDLQLSDDVLGAHLDAEAALADAPRREGTHFEVPKIIEPKMEPKMEPKTESDR
jgi:aspartyl-tRNA(Asn)/glutamyl-tRNA(Gln) amidotransferase subunit C